MEKIIKSSLETVYIMGKLIVLRSVRLENVIIGGTNGKSTRAGNGGVIIT